MPRRFCWPSRVAMPTALAACALVMVAELGARELTESRSEIERSIEGLASAYAQAPGDPEVRRAYADALLKLGNVWQANDVIAPLAARSSAPEDLLLGAMTARLTMDFGRAEELYDRALAATEEGSDAHGEAQSGLTLVYYLSEQFEKTRRFPDLEDEERGASFSKFLKSFEGEPYQMEWTASDRIARLPFTNDITQVGVLPEVEVVVNGEVVLLTLDTGGDRLYLDVSVAEKVGLRELAMSQNKYAYTQGRTVDEPLGVVDEVQLGGVVLRNVPAMGAHWKANGPTTDGVLGTAILRQFLSTIDYEQGEIALRPRGQEGREDLFASVEGRELVRMPFYLSSTHLMFAKGQIDGHAGLNMFLDSGLAASMPMIVVDETADLLGMERNDIEGTRFYWSPMADHGLDGFPGGPAQALGNVFVEGDNYRSQGFFWDALISHQYLWKLGFWIIDFDTMSYYFPKTSPIADRGAAAPASSAADDKRTVEVASPEAYVGDYDVAGAVTLEISAQEGRLYLKAPGQQPVPMEAYSDGTFGIPLAGATIEFQGDPELGITGLELHQAGNVTKATKQ